jgi:glucose-6-phosphate isomerase
MTGTHADLPAWKALEAEVTTIGATHLKDLLRDEERCASMIKEVLGDEGKVLLDYSRQRVTKATMEKLFKLAEECELKAKIEAMFGGEHINTTEDRAVLHTALRAKKGQQVIVDGKDVVPDVHSVLDKIKNFSDKVPPPPS